MGKIHYLQCNLWRKTYQDFGKQTRRKSGTYMNPSVTMYFPVDGLLIINLWVVLSSPVADQTTEYIADSEPESAVVSKSMSD
jgi:hypothetical protein